MLPPLFFSPNKPPLLLPTCLDGTEVPSCAERARGCSNKANSRLSRTRVGVYLNAFPAQSAAAATGSCPDHFSQASTSSPPPPRIPEPQTMSRLCKTERAPASLLQPPCALRSGCAKYKPRREAKECPETGLGLRRDGAAERRRRANKVYRGKRPHHKQGRCFSPEVKEAGWQLPSPHAVPNPSQVSPSS